MMILCQLFGHKAPSNFVCNGGLKVGRCGRCRADLIQTDAHWTPVPAGYRIAWRKGTGQPVPADPVAAPEPAPRSSDKRRGDRRSPVQGELPAYLGGRDRRRLRDRRKSFGRRWSEG